MRGWPLALLALRRALGARELALFAAVWALALAWSARAPRPLAALAALPDVAATSAALAARSALWHATALVVLPVLVFRAAGLLDAWRTREAHWIASRALAPSQALGWSWAGTWLAGAACVLATWGAAELAAGPDAPARARLARLSHPGLVLTPGQPSARVALAGPLAAAPTAGGRRAGRELALRLVPLPADPARAGQALVRILDAGGRALEEQRAPLGQGVRALRSHLGEGAATLELALLPGAAGGLVLEHDSLELLDPDARERSSSPALALATLAAWSAWCALATLLGVWLRPALAVAACLALAWLPALGWPGLDPAASAGLVERLGLLERRLVAPLPGAREWLPAPGAVLALLCLSRLAPPRAFRPR